MEFCFFLLIEGEQKAYYEGVEYSRKQLDEQVSQLQVENTDLRKLIADKLAVSLMHCRTCQPETLKIQACFQVLILFLSYN